MARPTVDAACRAIGLLPAASEVEAVGVSASESEAVVGMGR